MTRIGVYVKDTACLASIHPADVSALFMDSVLSLCEHEMATTGAPMERISLLSGPRIAAARNEVVTEFLNNRKAEWLVMSDADMVFAPDTVRVMIAAAKDKGAKVVGALCYGATITGRMNPTIFRLEENDKGARMVRWDHPPPKDSMVRCDATGTGFVLIHRDVLNALGDRYYGRTASVWFAETEMVFNGEYMQVGEDVTFCLRARKAGYEVYVCTAVEVHHVKEQVMTPRHFRRYLQDVKSGVTQEDRIHEAMLYTHPPRET